MRKLLRAKIHRATVTDADLDYEGSITIPPDLMGAADLVEFEAVCIWNVTTGSRFETYAMTGQAHSSAICINGAAAHLAAPGDIVIIAAFTYVPESQCRDFKPRLVFVDANNKPCVLEHEVPGPCRRKIPSSPMLA